MAVDNTLSISDENIEPTGDLEEPPSGSLMIRLISMLPPRRPGADVGGEGPFPRIGRGRRLNPDIDTAGPAEIGVDLGHRQRAP